MKNPKIRARLKLLPIAALLLCLWANSSVAQLVGQWDFISGNLSATVGGVPLAYADGAGGPTSQGTHFGSTASFGISAINGTNANVMAFPASGRAGGYNMPTPSAPNGGSPDLVNSYTIVMDVLFTTNGVVRPLVQTDDGIITPDADLVVDSSGGIGAPPGPFYGQITGNTWYRLAFSVDSDDISLYINGVQVGVEPSGGLDSRFALEPGSVAQLFQNSTLSGAAPGYVSSIQIWSTNLSAGEIIELGVPSATKIPTSIGSVPSYIVSRVPAVNTSNAPPYPEITVVLNPGGTTIDPSTLSLTLDGVTIPNTTESFDGVNYTLDTTVTNLLTPYSGHTAAVVYSDDNVGLQTNAWVFYVCRYQNITLPAPIYMENFDEVPVASLPPGWVATNWTDSIDAGTNIFDVNSDSYLTWLNIDVSDYANVYNFTDDYTSPGFPEVAGNRRLMIPPIVENGVLLTTLAEGNLLVAESDQRNGNQVDVVFTSDYDFTGQTNIYVSFHNLNEQNQDNICSVEYSIDQGKTWLPLLYMLDDGTTDSDGSDVVTNSATGQIDVNATFGTARNDQPHGLNYGAFIGAVWLNNTNLIPAIRPCRNDDPVQQKRIELFRLSAADNQPAVRMRFMQAGTGSWFFDIDDLGFYSIPEPVIFQQPTPVIADYNGPATFTVQSGGENLNYQWLFNGAPIAGATAPTYTIANALSNNIGLYSVTISNNISVVTSDQETLTLVYTPVVLIPPQDETIGVGENVTLSVSARGGRPLSYQWLLNSNAIPGATGTNYLISNAQTNQAGAYQVLVSNAFSTVLSPVANITVFAGAITNDLVVHLTFDNTYADSSGRGNDSQPVNSPVFTNGFIGGAVHTMNNGVPAGAPSINNYVTLGYPQDLLFGSDADDNASDFSVSFWTKIFQQNDDQSFIGNKDWNSGGNPGWIIDTESDGMKWNYDDNAEFAVPGEGSGRKDSPHFAPQMEDGGWHHVVVTFARHSVAKSYVDGVLTDTTALGVASPTNVLGSVDTIGIGWNVNIGQDGTGEYTDGNNASHVDMLMDDLGIWRRVLTDQEALGIFNAGLNGLALDKASTTSPGAKPQITLQPASTSAQTGASATFVASVLGSPTLAYQWYFGTSALAGATNTTLTLTNIGAAEGGNYVLVITNSYGAVTSSVAMLNYLGLPLITTNPVSAYVTAGSPETFTVAASSSLPVTYQWYGPAGAISDATNSAYTIASVAVSDAGSYYVTVANSAGIATSATAELAVFTGTLGSGLVAYLPFDGDYNDHSGNNNNGTPVGSPSFVTGQVGQALHFTTTSDASVINYVTLGYPPGLDFSTNDFSVAFWINYTNQADDSPFISNKDWSSSGNQGWGIFSQNGGNFRVNATGTSGTKEDVKPTNIIRDGKWHQLACSFWRGNFVTVYLDGNFVLTSPLTFGGSVDVAGNSVNIGQDGTGLYTDGGSAHIDGYIDEVTLWNRAITLQDETALYTAGAAGHSAFGSTVIKTPTITSVKYSGGSVTVTWINGIAPFTVQTKANLTDATWTPIGGSTSGQTLTFPVTGAHGFFRISGASQ